MNEEKKKQMEKAQKMWDEISPDIDPEVESDSPTEAENDAELEALQENLEEFKKGLPPTDIKEYLAKVICSRNDKISYWEAEWFVGTCITALERAKEKGSILRQMGEALGILKAPLSAAGLPVAQYKVRRYKK